MVKCACTTKQGKKCQRQVTMGKFCWQHVSLKISHDKSNKQIEIEKPKEGPGEMMGITGDSDVNTPVELRNFPQHMKYTYEFKNNGNYWTFTVANNKDLCDALAHILPDMVKRLKLLETIGGKNNIALSVAEYGQSPNTNDILKYIKENEPKTVCLSDWRYVPDNFRFILLR